MEFDLLAAFTKSTMVKYFEEYLKLSIKAEINKDTIYFDKYEELVAKMVIAKAKVGLKPSSYI